MSDVRKNADPGVLPVRKIEEANSLIIYLMATGTLMALTMFILGLVFKSDWFLMLAIYFVASSFAKGLFFFPERRNRRTRGFMIRRYENVRFAALIILAVTFVLLILLILKRNQQLLYPLAATIFVIIITIADVFLFVMFYSSFHGLGRFMDGLRYIKYGDFLVLFLLIIHIISAIFSGNGTAAGPLWILTAVFFAVIIAAAGYLVVYAGNKIQSYMVRRGN